MIMKKFFALFTIIFALNANLLTPVPIGRYIISFKDIMTIPEHPHLTSVQDKLVLYDMFLKSPDKRKRFWFPDIYNNYSSIYIVTYD